MGGRQSVSRATSSTPEHTAPLPHVKKKEALSLQKSRAKYLSEKLGLSETNLRTVGLGSREELVPNGTEVMLGEASEGGVFDGETIEEVVVVEVEDSEGGEGRDEVEEELITCQQAPRLRAYNATRTAREAAKADPGIKRDRPTFQPIGRYHRAPSFHDEVDHRAVRVRPEDYDFFFENVVFEGGGNKGLAYCGAVRYLEELGLVGGVRRLAGASAGGMFAGLMAVGYNSYEIEQFLSDRIDKLFLDASCGYCSLLPNLLSSFGWNPGLRVYDWFGDKLYDKTGDPDITFHQVYQKFGKMLCVVVTNLNQMTTEYCHPKTTPEMPIRLAIRMSMAIPGLFSATRYGRLGSEDLYVDGGVLCNYPVHCYDGWYLSMKPEDSFVRRLQPLRDIPLLMERNNRFGTFNDKTLGMLLYSDAEEDILRINLEKRVGCLLPPAPKEKTKLFVLRQKEAKQKLRAEREHAKVVQAVDSFLRVLKKHNIDSNDVIEREELEAAFKDETEFPREEAEVLFGKDFTVGEAFDLLDRDDNGLIRYDELVRFIEENGVCLQNRFLGYQRKNITNFRSFLGTLQSTLIFNVKKLYVEERDLDRTVGINTGHVHTTDFVLEEPDRDFVVARGYNSMKAFLQYYVVRHPDKVRRKSTNSLSIPDIEEAPYTPTEEHTTRAQKQGAQSFHTPVQRDGEEAAQGVVQAKGTKAASASDQPTDSVPLITPLQQSEAAVVESKA